MEKSFTLNDIKPADFPIAKPINTQSIFEDYLKDSDRKLPANIEFAQSTKAKGLFQFSNGINGFLGTVTACFSKHYPLELSPDDLLFVIIDGLSIHINQNSEQLKEFFSDQPSKYKLEVFRNEFVKGSDKNDWPSVFTEFNEKIKDKILDKDLISQMQQKFTTTTDKSMISRNIAIMSSMSSYCSYTLHTMCGIPKICLRGTQQDWLHVLDFVKYLKKYGLGFWCDKLELIINEFVMVYDDKINLKFWNDMIKIDNESGGPYYTGWILSLYPYIVINKGYVINNQDRLTSHCIPSGVSSVEMIWNYLGNKTIMKLHAGIMCATVSKRNNLKPKMLYCVEDCSGIVSNGYLITETSANGMTVTPEIMNIIKYGKFCYPASLHYATKYGHIDAIVNCDLCKTKNLQSCIAYAQNNDLCLKCAGAVVEYIKYMDPVPTRY